MKEEYQYSDLTERIIGCAKRIHQPKGPEKIGRRQYKRSFQSKQSA